MFIFARCLRSVAAVTPAKYELDIMQVTAVVIIRKIWENNGTEKISLVTPPPGTHLLPVWHQAITLTNIDILSTWPLRTNFSKKNNQNTNNFFQQNAFEKGICKIVHNSAWMCEVFSVTFFSSWLFQVPASIETYYARA